MPQISTPTMTITNVAYQDATFRKLHLENAKIQSLDIMHCVMYPRPVFDMPILGIDLVEKDGVPLFAIADICPITNDLSLPDYYVTRIVELQQRLGLHPASRAAMPAWGKHIFSDLCVMTRDVPDAFVEYALTLIHINMAYAKTLDATNDHASRARIRNNLSRFSIFQLKNPKTKAALAIEFGKTAAETYMRTHMFDS
jgi:phycocyanobilin:ferredoxin oxidoreductase